LGTFPKEESQNEGIRPLEWRPVSFKSHMEQNSKSRRRTEWGSRNDARNTSRAGNAVNLTGGGGNGGGGNGGDSVRWVQGDWT